MFDSYILCSCSVPYQLSVCSKSLLHLWFKKVADVVARSLSLQNAVTRQYKDEVTPAKHIRIKHMTQK